MKIFIVSKSEYGGQVGDKPEMKEEMAPTLFDLLERLFGPPDEETWNDYEFIKSCEQANGDGMPYIMIYDVHARQQVFG